MSHDASSIRQANSSFRQGTSTWFTLPPPLKRLFDRFPLHVYHSNELPTSASKSCDKHVLFVFTTRDATGRFAPSYNPSCLRWQTYLKIEGIDFYCIASNNHASPTGSLPFLVTAPDGSSSQTTVSTKGFRRWIAGQKENTPPLQEPVDIRYETYQPLIDGRLRLAWLYQLYICPENAHVVQRLYLAAASSNVLVQSAVGHQLRQAAETELRKATFLQQKSDAELWRQTEDAFFALSTLLGEQAWFFGQIASEFDAMVFAYTHLILDDETMRWRSNRLAEMLRKHQNLTSHRERILDLYY